MTLGKHISTLCPPLMRFIENRRSLRHVLQPVEKLIASPGPAEQLSDRERKVREKYAGRNLRELSSDERQEVYDVIRDRLARQSETENK